VRDRFITLDSKLYRYVVAHGHNDDPILQELAEETARLGGISGMQISPEQGTLMTILARAIGNRGGSMEPMLDLSRSIGKEAASGRSD
jgi:predicted O-methyltransferase YrrM